ncbi:hypothetical protein RR46_00916 [Papilio xuthus]|uniref:Uncharacterized protein n=1 Tax=Papilio xuthus TaxID=66420 RepID=A0A0N0P9I9_PAPXU|nr:hypothetical protein RR46_00916 [Papilio xuthus]
MQLFLLRRMMQQKTLVKHQYTRDSVAHGTCTIVGDVSHDPFPTDASITPSI